MGTKSKSMASSMISQAIQHAKERKAVEDKEKKLMFRIRKQLSMLRADDNNASKLQAFSDKNDDGRSNLHPAPCILHPLHYITRHRFRPITPPVHLPT